MSACGHDGWVAGCPTCEELHRAALSAMSERYVESGGDPDLCEFCSEPLDDSRSWQTGLDGAGAHADCLAIYLDSEED